MGIVRDAIEAVKEGEYGGDGGIINVMTRDEATVVIIGSRNFLLDGGDISIYTIWISE